MPISKPHDELQGGLIPITLRDFPEHPPRGGDGPRVQCQSQLSSGQQVPVMSTLKKNKRIKRAKQVALYGDNTPAFGRSLCQRGKAKYLGGNGRKTTGITLRKFRLNLQSIRVLEDGKIVRRNVSVKQIRSGLITKPVVRAPFTIDKHA